MHVCDAKTVSEGADWRSPTSITSKSSPGSMTMTTLYAAAVWPGMLPRNASLMAHALSMASSSPGFFQMELVWIHPLRNTLLGS